MRPIIGFVLAGALAAACAAQSLQLEKEKSVAGVQAIQKGWTRAFVTGDTEYLEQLLAEDYVSVGGNGAARNKAEVIALARKFAARGASVPDRPPSPVQIRGDAAIVVHDDGSERSVDVFYYRDGKWQAWYSQHTPRQLGS